MRRILLEVKRRHLMPISRSIDLAPPKNTGKRQREVINTKDEKASVSALRQIPLDPIPQGTTIPIPLVLVPQGTRLPFPDSVPTFYGRFYEINGTSPYFETRLRKAHIFIGVQHGETWEDYMGEHGAMLLRTSTHFLL